ncbi:MAG: hypothetical protein GY904_11345, partial [Planctomycetaceae bacterium]|nr:hypothetical protein [Planctomycetaceae bacterium]
MRESFGSVIAQMLSAVLWVGLLQTQAFTQESPVSVNSAEAMAFLDERGEALTDADLALICRARELSELDLSGCTRITDEGLSCLADLEQLKSLSLSGCHRITIAGIEGISELPKLERLDISQTRLPLPQVYSELTKLPSL